MPEPYADPGVLLSTEWIANNLEDPSIIIAEVNTNLETGYHQGHIPGAVGWGLHTDMENQVRRDVPSVAQLESLLGQSGISKDTTIVLYGDGNNRSATWAFWVLKYYRHRDVRLIDGGRMKWIAEGRPLSTEKPMPTVKTYKTSAPDRSLRAMKEHIVDNLENPSVMLLDTRTYEEYAGLLTSAPNTPQPDIYRRGRIPGAIHVPWDEGSAKDGTFRPIAELRELYSRKGLYHTNEVIPYCRLGIRASYSWFVIKYLLNYPRVRNYDGSWTEWGNAAGVPIESS